MTAVSANLPVTVITIGRNSLMGLQETVASVRSQTYEPLRHVVIDGDSTDGSVEWLRTHANQAECMWISEPDAGIYDAMNKALIHVDGGYLLYLHAGDTFVDQDAVQRSMAAIGAASPLPDLAIGWSRMVASSGTPMPYVVGGATPNALTSAHESTFFSAAFHHGERYDTSLRLAADYAFFQELAQRDGLCVLRLETTVSNFVFGGRSNDPSFDGARFLERAQVNANMGDSTTAATYLRIAFRMVTRSVVYRIAGADRAAELFLRLACRRGNSGARPAPVHQVLVGGSSPG